MNGANTLRSFTYNHFNRPNQLKDSLEWNYGSCEAGTWTDWTSHDHPSGYGDGETFGHRGGDVCGDGEHVLPTSFEVRVVGTKVDYSLTGDNVFIDPKIGFDCLNRYQSDGRCENYEARFCCPGE